MAPSAVVTPKKRSFDSDSDSEQSPTKLHKAGAWDDEQTAWLIKEVPLDAKNVKWAEVHKKFKIRFPGVDKTPNGIRNKHQKLRSEKKEMSEEDVSISS